MNTISTLPEPDLEPDEAVIQTVGPRCADGNGTLTPLFFSDDLVDIARAKAMCTKCPLSAPTACVTPSTARSHGASGAASSCSTGASSRPSGRAGVHPSAHVRRWSIDELGPVVEVA